MTPRPVSPLTYATPATERPEVLTAATASWRSAAAAAWLLLLLAGVAGAADALYDGQMAIGPCLSAFRDVLAVGQLGFGVALGTAYALAVPTVAAVGLGAAAAAVLYHWPRRRLAWLAVAPVAVGCWSMVAIVVQLSATAGSLAALGAAIVIQGGLVYVGLRIGRPVALWLARYLLPPPLRAPLIALWVV